MSATLRQLGFKIELVYANLDWQLAEVQLLKGVHCQTKDLNSGQPINLNKNLVQGLTQILLSLEKSVRNQNTLRTICNHHTMTLWSALLDHTDKKMNFCKLYSSILHQDMY